MTNTMWEEIRFPAVGAGRGPIIGFVQPANKETDDGSVRVMATGILGVFCLSSLGEAMKKLVAITDEIDGIVKLRWPPQGAARGDEEPRNTERVAPRVDADRPRPPHFATAIEGAWGKVQDLVMLEIDRKAMESKQKKEQGEWSARIGQQDKTIRSARNALSDEIGITPDILRFLIEGLASAACLPPDKS